MNRSNTLRLSAIAGLAASTLISSSTLAQTKAWNNAAGGSAGTSTNWTPNGVPAATDILNYNLAGSYSVSFPSTVPAAAQHNFNVGAISLSMLSPHVVGTQFVVGLTAGSTPNLSFTSGSISSPIIFVGGNATSNATFTVTGPTADMFATGTNGTRIGNGGIGTLNILNGGSIRTTNAVSIAALAGSQGTVTVSGVSGTTPAELVTTDPVNGDLNVALNGPGSLAVTAGGLVDIADDVFIAPTATFVGNATLGTAAAFDSRLNVAGDLHIGHNTSGAAAGAGSLTLNTRGVVTVAGTTFLGDSNGGSGTLTMHEGAALTTNSLAIDSSNGVFNLTGGDLTVSGGTVTTSNGRFTVTSTTGESPVMALTGGATMSLTAAPGTAALTVGVAGSTLMDVRSGSHLNITSGDIMIGEAAGSGANLQIQTNGQLATSGPVTAGNLGTGVLNVNATASTGSIRIGASAGGSGEVISNGPQGRLNAHGPIYVGGTSAGNAGAGNLRALNGGAITVTDDTNGISIQVWSPDDQLQIIGSTSSIIANGSIRVNGQFDFQGGTIDADLISLDAPLNYSLNGTIKGQLRIPGSTVSASLAGDLTLATSTVDNQAGLINFGSIEVGAHTLTIPSVAPFHELNTAHVAAGGHIVCAAALGVDAGRTLSGDGTIDAPVNNSGTITGSGTGLLFNGMLTGVGQAINGSAIRFGATGGFTGSGGFSNATNVSAQPGSVIHATGNLSMGNSSSADGFASAGRIEVDGQSQVAVLDSTEASVRDIAFLTADPDNSNPPSVLCPRNMLISGGTVTGTGIIGGGINSQTTIQNTLLSPGIGPTRGTIFINDNSALQLDSSVDIDIFDSTTHDLIFTLGHLLTNPIRTISSDITLNGTLTVRVANGHTPANGESHQILATAHGLLGPDGRIFGAFATINKPPHWIVKTIYVETGNLDNGIYAIYCPADFNEDQTVDFFDYLDFVDAFSSGDGTADFNHDFAIDFFDYLDFVDAFSVGCDPR